MRTYVSGEIPKFGHERWLWEQTVIRNNSLGELAIRTSTLLSHAQSVSTDHIEANKRELYETAINPDLKNADIELLDYFRVKHYQSTYDALVRAPQIFSDRSSEEYRLERERLIDIDGIYAASGVLLEEALALYDFDTGLRTVDYQHLRGVINELTTAALLNRAQNTDRMALPGLVADDVFNGADVRYWGFHAATDQGYAVPIQVKTTVRQKDIDDLMPSTVLVSADTLHNQENGHSSFFTARLIVKELLHGASMSNGEQRHLDAIERSLLEHISRESAAHHSGITY
jgi:hypothetical protein